MRLARLAAAGLAVGVVAGFVIALLRPRPVTPLLGARAVVDPATDPASWDEFEQADQSSVLDVHVRRPVTG
jgi:hypothetical protein